MRQTAPAGAYVMLRAWSCLFLLVALAAACSKTPPRAPTPEREAEPVRSSAGTTGIAAPAESPKPIAAEPASKPAQAPAEVAVAAPPKAPVSEPTAPAADDCLQRVTSNLPGASLRVTTKRCAYSRAELSSGVPITYEVRFERPLRGVRPHQSREPLLAPWPQWASVFEEACFRPRDASNLVVAYWISDGGMEVKERRLWCPDCPGPRCPPIVTPPTDVKAGAHRQTTERWTGFNTLQSVSFPPGDYQLTLRADGSYVPDGSSEPELVHMETTRRMSITP